MEILRALRFKSSYAFLKRPPDEIGIRKAKAWREVLQLLYYFIQSSATYSSIVFPFLNIVTPRKLFTVSFPG